MGVFFIHMDWKWKYATKGMSWSHGGYYLPDFEIRLPNLEEWYVEVKPDNFDKFDQDE